MSGFLNETCGGSCYELSKDLALATGPLLGVVSVTVAGATLLYGISKYCLGRLDLSLAAQRQAQDLGNRDMRLHRQDQTLETQSMSYFAIAATAAVVGTIVLATLPTIGGLTAAIITVAVGYGAVVLTQQVHDRLAQHDGRVYPFRW